MVMIVVSLEDSEPFRQRQALIDAAQAGDARANGGHPIDTGLRCAQIGRWSIAKGGGP